MFVTLLLFFFTAMNAQPTITPAPGYEWVLVNTEYHIDKAKKVSTSGGCPIIQQQVDGNIGDGRNGGCGDSLGGQNFPASATVQYGFKLSISQPYSSDIIPEDATSGTVFISAEAKLHVLNVPMEDQYFQALAIGGEVGNFSEFEFLKSTTSSWEIPSLHLSDSLDEIIEASFRIKTNDALKNKHHFYGNDFLFKKSKNSLIAQQKEQIFPISIPKEVSNLKINIHTTSSVAIKRINGQGDARIEYQQKSTPQVNLISEIQCWKIQKINSITESSNSIANNTSSKNIVTNIPQITCFPNPATDQISVQFPKKVKRGSLLIVNNNGNVIYKSSIKSIDQGSSVTIELDDFAPGIYQLAILNKAGKLEGAARFVKVEK